jgi:hypothetical protein
VLKKTRFMLLGFVAMVSFLFIAQAQTEEQGWKKTITLPSGEVVCDLNGEWDVVFYWRAQFIPPGSGKNRWKITQQGNSFQGIRMIGRDGFPKGSLAIEGELDKNGFTKVIYLMGGNSAFYPRAKISKDGNTIELKQSDMYEMELTRR